MNARETLIAAVEALEKMGFVILSRSEVEAKDKELEKLREALEQIEQQTASDVEPDWKTVRKKFYHSEWGTSKLLEARNGGLVTDEGEAWFYEYTSKDGTGGSYDLLFRREPYTRPPESRLRECATEGCNRPATVRFERGGVGSEYCYPCYLKMQALAQGADDERA